MRLTFDWSPNSKPFFGKGLQSAVTCLEQRTDWDSFFVVEIFTHEGVLC